MRSNLAFLLLEVLVALAFAVWVIAIIVQFESQAWLLAHQTAVRATMLTQLIVGEDKNKKSVQQIVYNAEREMITSLEAALGKTQIIIPGAYTVDEYMTKKDKGEMKLPIRFIVTQ